MTTAKEDRAAANGFFDRHGLQSIVAFVALFVLLELSCFCSLITPDLVVGARPRDLGSFLQPPPPPLDIGLLSREPCEAPCWQGLTPGESTEDDVNYFLETSEFVDRDSVFRGDITTGHGDVIGVTIDWDSTAGRRGGDFAVEGGVLEDMTLYPGYDLTLERLMERYGPPEKYTAHLSGIEFVFYEVTLYYPARGFTVYLVLDYDDPTLQPDTVVRSFWYFRAAPLERFLELRYEHGYVGGTTDEALEYMHNWKGYGPIELD